MRILVVEDERHTQRFLRHSLKACGHEVVEAETGVEAINCFAEFAADFILLDLGLPDMDGKGVICRVRQRSAVPIIVISAREDEHEKVMALDLGANDFIEKPFVIGELFARIRKVLRTSSPNRMIHAGALAIDTDERSVQINGEAVKLTRKEYELLVALGRQRGQAVDYDTVLKAVFGVVRRSDLGHLRVIIRQLRLKIEEDPSNPRFVQTVLGVGYAFPEANV
jgi:two-component system KDP operon response regulator KdpE